MKNRQERSIIKLTNEPPLQPPPKETAMSRNKTKISKRLIEMGFTPPFDFYFWNNDGWYVDNENELNHRWIGQNSNHVMEMLNRQSKEDVIKRRCP